MLAKSRCTPRADLSSGPQLCLQTNPDASSSGVYVDLLKKRPGPGEDPGARSEVDDSRAFFYLFPRTVSNTSSVLLKVSVLEFFSWSITSCGALLFWASDITSSLLAGKFIFGRYCWSCPRSRLLRPPKLPRPMFLFLPSRSRTSIAFLPTIPSAKPALQHVSFLLSLSASS